MTSTYKPLKKSTHKLLNRRRFTPFAQRTIHSLIHCKYKPFTESRSQTEAIHKEKPFINCMHPPPWFTSQPSLTANSPIWGPSFSLGYGVLLNGSPVMGTSPHLVKVTQKGTSFTSLGYGSKGYFSSLWSGGNLDAMGVLVWGMGTTPPPGHSFRPAAL